jgi:cell division protein FtsB
MRRKKKKSFSFRKKLFITAFCFFFLILLIPSLFGKKGMIEIFRTQRAHRVLVQDIEYLEKKLSKLEKEIEELENDPKAVEMKARDKLWLMKPDEIVIIKKEK